MKSIIWKFDMLIYRLFYWRWNKRLANRSDIRKLFLNYFNAWEAIEREPAMGIGPHPPKLEISIKENLE
jgi:hypothetical protein